MKYLMIVLFMIATAVSADQRMETEQNLCHFVKPAGIAAGDNGNEVKASGCESDIITNDDGTRTGSISGDERSYAPGTLPISDDYEYTNVDSGVVCNMVDGNNTYQTADWTVEYNVNVPGLNQFKRAFGKDSSSDWWSWYKRYDLNDDGVVNFEDLSIFKEDVSGVIIYTMACRNGAQQ